MFYKYFYVCSYFLTTKLHVKESPFLKIQIINIVMNKSLKERQNLEITNLSLT